jgi:carbonic anhydrase/acetyltransferase-like protein (isoleucine patch superfamily)
MIFSLGDRHPLIEGDGHFIVPNATIVGSVRLKQRASVWFNAVLRGDSGLIEIGRNSNVQDGAILHTDPGIDLIVGDNVTVGHQAVLHGCLIGNNSLVGMGSTLLNRSRIGNNCIVGARTLVTGGKQFPDGVLILGSPARIVRELKAREFDLLKTSVDLYLRSSRRFAEELGAGG